MKQADIIEFQVRSKELEQVQEYLGKLGEQQTEVAQLLAALDAFAQLPTGEETLFPLANGIFAQGTLATNATLFLNIGEGVIVPRTVVETKTLITEQLGKLQEQQRLATNHQEELYQQLVALEQRVSRELAEDSPVRSAGSSTPEDTRMTREKNADRKR